MGLLWGTPEQDQISLLAGSALLGGQNVGQQLGGIGPAIAPVLAQQAQNRQNETVKNQTLNMLRGQNPELAQLVETGALTPTDAVKQYLQQRAEAQKAQQPDYSFLNVDGRIVRTDKKSGNINELADYSKPKLPAIAEEYNWAKENGFNGTPQEYQMWKANLSKQKGMIIEATPDGGFRLVQGDVDANAMPKLTESEGKNAGFLKRALSAEKELSSLEAEGTSLWNKAADAVPVLGNYAKSDSAQKYDQAQRNFINAVLRRESGAVITPEEFDNARKQYFPQPGDSQAVILQKRKNREDAIKGFEVSSGPAATKVKEMDAAEQNSQAIPAEDYFK